MHKIGFIGCGNMGRAIIKGIVTSGVCEPGDIIASAHTQATIDAAHEQFGIDVTLDNTQAARAEIVVLAVKPYMFDEVVPQIAPSLPKDVILVSIAPAKTLAWLAETAGVTKVVRLMPNTPAAVGEGMTSVVPNDACTQEDIDRVLAIVNSFGKSEFIPEKLIDAGSAVAGCAPAFFYMFIEAMADAAARAGVPLCRPGGGGLGQDGARIGPASRRAQGCRVLSGRHDHRRRAHAGGDGHARRGDRCADGYRGQGAEPLGRSGA